MQDEHGELFRQAVHGDVRVSEAFFAALYGELHQLAEKQLRRGGGFVSLSATTLLHEAYLDMSSRSTVEFPDRGRFMGYAARAMRGIVIDHARRAVADKRGGGVFAITLDDQCDLMVGGHSSSDFDRLSDALDELAVLEPALAEIVDAHFFCGFALAEIAELRGTSERTIQRSWQKARMLLHNALRDVTPPRD
ncbi:MAG: ECF-type sigma factor [bacterium]